MIEKLKEFYIVNSTSVDSVVTLKLEGDCGTYEDVTGFSQTIPGTSTTKIVFPSDGIYEVYIDGVLDAVAKYYKDLFASLMIFTGATICGTWGSTCKSFSSCSNVPPDYATNAHSKMLLYYANYSTKYDTALITALGKARCSTKDAWATVISNEKLRGISDTSELMRIELAHLYLELYTVDAGIEAAEDIAELKQLYNFDIVDNCIGKLGVDDCVAVVPTGTPHTRTLTATPSTFGLGTATNIVLSYKFTSNDDTFTSIVDTNIPNVTIAKLQNGFTNNETVNATTGESYYITYGYDRDAVSYQNTITVTTTTYVPQWFGGESAEDDFAKIGGLATIADIKANITNISPTLQVGSSGSSSNSNTLNEYIWWITENPIQFFIGAFEIVSGPWSASCDPNSYAIIHKTVTTTMEDNVTQRVLHYYRTCPLQDLTGLTLNYTITDD